MKILLNYAVDFTQVSGTATANLAFLHNIGVITSPPSEPPTAVILNPAGTESIPATVQLSGFFLAGTEITFTGTKDPIPPLTYNSPYVLAEDMTATQLAEVLPDFLDGVDQVTVDSNGTIIEYRAFNGGTDVTIDTVVVDVSGAVPLTSQIVEVVDPNELQYLSNSPEDLIAAFDGGLSKMYVVMVNDIADVPALILEQECTFYTLYGSRDYTEAEMVIAMAGWQGVQAITYNIQADAKTYAANVNSCGFYEDTDVPLNARAYFGIFSFAKLLSANFWRNQQYTPVNAANGNPVTALGLAESLFDDRASFYLNDEEQGTRLAFFVAGGLSITDPYIDKEVEVVMQSEMLNYLASTQPMNIETNRLQLEQIGNTILGQYTDLGLLDPDGVNTVTIRKSNQAFIVNGEMTTANAEALWRVKIDATENAAV